MGFECAKCKAERKDARLIMRGIIYQTATCITCGDIVNIFDDEKVVVKWSFHGDNGDNGDDGDIDDHNSQWGGAGPDCPIMRREAALYNNSDGAALPG